MQEELYDESGDYVDDFSIDIRDIFKHGNLGVHSADSVTGLVNGFTTTIAGEKLLASIGPGSYTKIWLLLKETKQLVVNKARETLIDLTFV